MEFEQNNAIGKPRDEVVAIKRRISSMIRQNPDKFPNVTGVGVGMVDSVDGRIYCINVYLIKFPNEPEESKYRKSIAGIPVVYRLTGVITAL